MADTQSQFDATQMNVGGNRRTRRPADRISNSLLDQLPGIVNAGKRQAAQILEQMHSRNRVVLQTRELVIPSKDTSTLDSLRPSQIGEMTCGPNRLIYGDNLLTMAALLAGDDETPSLREKIDFYLY